MHFTVCAPEDYRLEEKLLKALVKKYPSASIEQSDNFKTALEDAAIVYTDVWTSMGQEAEAEERRAIFGPYQVNGALMKMAPKSCRFMHCLPAKRGLEVTDDVIDGEQSIVFQQAQNRMHLAKGLLLLGPGKRRSDRVTDVQLCHCFGALLRKAVSSRCDTGVL